MTNILSASQMSSSARSQNVALGEAGLAGSPRFLNDAIAKRGSGPHRRKTL